MCGSMAISVPRRNARYAVSRRGPDWRPTGSPDRRSGRPSLSLEPEFWDEIDRAIAEDGRSLAGLVAEIDEARGEDPLASSVRVWVLERLRAGR